MARETSDYPTSIDVFDNATTDFNPGDAVPSSDFEVALDAIKTIQTKLGITGGTALLDSAVTVNNSEADKDFRVAATGATNAFFIQGSDGKIGIGTAVIPHGGVGDALLALEGIDNSPSLGPHIQITTSVDDYPLFTMRNRYHDGIFLYFDAYYDGGTKSSDAGSNFIIYKATDRFTIAYDSGIAQGAAITWNNGIVLDTSGNVKISSLAGVGARNVVAAADGTLSAP